jgi:hypothetical protein
MLGKLLDVGHTPNINKHLLLRTYGALANNAQDSTGILPLWSKMNTSI